MIIPLFHWEHACTHAHTLKHFYELNPIHVCPQLYATHVYKHLRILTHFTVCLASCFDETFSRPVASLTACVAGLDHAIRGSTWRCRKDRCRIGTWQEPHDDSRHYRSCQAARCYGICSECAPQTSIGEGRTNRLEGDLGLHTKMLVSFMWMCAHETPYLFSMVRMNVYCADGVAYIGLQRRYLTSSPRCRVRIVGWGTALTHFAQSDTPR